MAGYHPDSALAVGEAAGKEAPIAAIFADRDLSRGATDSGHSRDLGGILGSTLN